MFVVEKFEHMTQLITLVGNLCKNDSLKSVCVQPLFIEKYKKIMGSKDKLQKQIGGFKKTYLDITNYYD